MMNFGRWFFSKGRYALPAAALPFLALAMSDGAQAAPYVDPKDCGGDAQPACYISAAKTERKINPGGDAFRDPRKGGEWWTCGGDGWTRTWAAVTAGDACAKGGWFGQKKKATFVYSEKAMVDDGTFADILSGEWWRCPSGFTRNANLAKSEACSATIGQACDSGLVDVRDSRREFSWNGGGYTCYKKGQCGAEGQRPCQLAVDGIQTSCNKGLEEDFIKNECRIGVFGDIDDLDKDFDKFFTDTWEGRAIIDQVELSLDVPLAKATMIGSHNSYNSKAYDYIDPNQYLTLLDQLKGGAHFVELDLHDRALVRPTGHNGEWGETADGVVLCHSKHEKGKPGGCAEGDRYLGEGLDELKVFLEDPKYKNRVFIVYFENFSKDTSAIYDAVQSKIGTYVYNSGGCKPIPAATLTPRQILDAGKRVLIWNGSEVESKCSSHENFKNMVFTDMGWDGRTWEDEASLTDVAGTKSKWLPADVVTEIEKGKNLANHDFLYINDVYKAMAWSWNVNEPNNVGGEHCAVQTSAARLGQGHVWNDISCSAGGLAYACENSNGDWKVTTASSTGQWSQGDAMCKKDHGDAYFFSVPATAEENVKLAKAKPAGWTVWLNYTDKAQEGTWVGKHRWNSQTCGKGQPCIQNAGHPTFSAEEKLTSPDGKTTALMQGDCNFVIYATGGRPIWASDTHGQGSGCQLVFQNDGNLVIYKPGGVPIWASDTAGKGDGLTLHMQDNGNLVMHDATKQVVWSTGSRS